MTHHLTREPSVRRRNGVLTITDGAVLSLREKREAALKKAWITRRKPQADMLVRLRGEIQRGVAP